MVQPPKLSGSTLPFLVEVGACPKFARCVTCSCEVGGAVGLDCTQKGNPQAARKTNSKRRESSEILMKRTQKALLIRLSSTRESFQHSGEGESQPPRGPASVG